MKKSTLLALLVTGCMAGGLLWNGKKAEGDAPPVAEAPVSPDTVAPAAVSPPAPGASLPSPRQHTASVTSAESPRIAALMAELENARDYRVVFERLLANPDERSGLYAMHILYMCMNFRDWDSLPLAPSNSTRQDQARRTFTDRCASFSTDEIASGRMGALSEDPRIEGRFTRLRDTLAAVIGSADRERAVLTEILETGDPLLLHHMSMMILARDSGRTTLSGEQPDNSPATVLRAANHAWSSAICDVTGAGCGPQEMNVVDVCARHGICMNSRQALNEELIRMDAGDQGLALYRHMLRRFREVLRNRDVSALLTPAARAPGP